MKDTSAHLHKEKVIYSGRPSHYVNCTVFTVCGIVIVLASLSPYLWDAMFQGTVEQRSYFLWGGKILFWGALGWGILAWLKVQTHRYELTTDRFRETVGVWSRVEEALELYRVRDITFVQPFSLRMMGLGNVVLDTSDRSHPVVVIHAVKEGRKITDMIRQHAEAARIRNGIQQFERM